METKQDKVICKYIASGYRVIAYTRGGTCIVRKSYGNKVAKIFDSGRVQHI